MVGIANNSFVSVKVSKELIKEHTTVRRSHLITVVALAIIRVLEGFV